MQTTEAFYNELAEYYNNMINFEEALSKREAALKKFVGPDMKTAADIGCGTGIDSIALTRCGLKVTAFDISEKMIEKAEQTAVKSRAKISFLKSSADEIPAVYNNSFSMVASLGNTIANLNEMQVEKAIKVIYNLLQPAGIFLMQVLNFTRILKDKERIVNITRSGEYFYTRFYDFEEKNIKFNILKFNRANTTDRSLNTSALYPHSYQYLSDLLMAAGFSGIKLWENFNRKLFEPAASKDLIIEAVKQ
jgi:ubiquinone/menaquinone biosynthesis C-methylase UbiE